MAVLSMIPPLAILPILFIVFGLDELSKVMLIVIGITPVLARDLEQRAREIPAELLVKAQTLGANSWTAVLRDTAAIAGAAAAIAAADARGGLAIPDLVRRRFRRRPAWAIGSSWCDATCRWMSSCPMWPGSRSWPGRWTGRCA